MVEEYITQVSDEIKERVTKKHSQEISRTESRILGASSKLDEFLLNPKARTSSVAVPGTSRNNNLQNWKTTEDFFIGDPCPEVKFSACHTINLNDSDEEETHYLVTGVEEENPYCYRGTSSGKNKKERFTSQPQFRSKNTPGTIEADQILLVLQQLTTNNNSANFNSNSNINRILKLPKSLRTTKPTFDGKLEIFELFEGLFQTSLKIHNQLPEEDKISYLHSLMCGDALHTF